MNEREVVRGWYKERNLESKENEDKLKKWESTTKKLYIWGCINKLADSALLSESAEYTNCTSAEE